MKFKLVTWCELLNTVFAWTPRSVAVVWCADCDSDRSELDASLVLNGTDSKASLEHVYLRVCNRNCSFKKWSWSVILWNCGSYIHAYSKAAADLPRSKSLVFGSKSAIGFWYEINTWLLARSKQLVSDLNYATFIPPSYLKLSTGWENREQVRDSWERAIINSGGRMNCDVVQ